MHGAQEARKLTIIIYLEMFIAGLSRVAKTKSNLMLPQPLS